MHLNLCGKAKQLNAKSNVNLDNTVPRHQLLPLLQMLCGLLASGTPDSYSWNRKKISLKRLDDRYSSHILQACNPM